MSRDAPPQPADLAVQPPPRDDLVVTTAATLNDDRLMMHPGRPKVRPERDEWVLADRDGWVAFGEMR